jgi:hypothetical protein
MTSTSSDKWALVFFELIGCPPCKRFRHEELQKLVNDPEVKKLVNVFNSVEGQEKKEEIINGKPVTRIITYEIPDRFKGKVRWNPFFMLVHGKDHENKILQEGNYFSYGMNEHGRHDGVSNFTSEQLKKWIISTVTSKQSLSSTLQESKTLQSQESKISTSSAKKNIKTKKDKHVKFEDENQDDQNEEDYQEDDEEEEINNKIKGNFAHTTPTAKLNIKL